jgi:hypothetical protein
MRVSCQHVIVGLSLTLGLLTACSGIRHADVLTTPLPGKILSFVAMKGPCSSDGCFFRYRIRITNPTDRDVHVQRCLVTHPRLTFLFIEGPAGVFVRERTTRTITAKYQVSLPKSAASALQANVASCEGLDWHGDPPA